MEDKLQYIYRSLSNFLPTDKDRRLVLITGARQTGKTTLAKNVYPHLRYINFDSPEIRLTIRNIPTNDWVNTVGTAILDEAQKEPSVFEKIKYCYDESSLRFSVILGSSQILLLKNIRESLAGRIWIYELWPLMVAELLHGNNSFKEPLLIDLLESESFHTVLTQQPSAIIGNYMSTCKNIENYLLQWGGMPALIHLNQISEKQQWLKNYIYTYLERDLSDLVRLHDLEPFQKFQKLSALRCSSLLNYSELARDAGISVDTARRYLEYLKLSYQVVLLQPYMHNLTSSTVKTPKLYWIDNGILRQLTGNISDVVTGQIYENYIVSEMYKCIKTSQKPATLYFYRTRSGLEVDIVIETIHGLIFCEIKNREEVVKSDYTTIKSIAQKLGKKFLGGLIIYRGDRLQLLDNPSIWAIPSWRLFS
jgi:predicted AAA+ superfamily ATPase